MSAIDVTRAVSEVLRAEAPSLRSLDDLIAARTIMTDAHPIVRAVSLASRARDLGSAFAAGYWAATEQLLASCGASHAPSERTSLAVTEKRGAHPRAIELTLDAEGSLLRLRGEKSFATLADRSTHVLVVAKDAREPDAPPSPHPKLVAVRVAVPSEGVAFEEGMRVPFCPEISHPVLRLATPATKALVLVGGDAFVDVLQPFRTIEDRAVSAAALAYLLAWSARAGLALDVHAKLAQLLSGALLHADRQDDELERLAALGASAMLRSTLAELLPLFEAKRDTFADGEAFTKDLARDAGLLLVAERLRVTRAGKALASLGARRDAPDEAMER